MIGVVPIKDLLDFVTFVKRVIDFYILDIAHQIMNLKLRCNDYGFECKFVLDEEKTTGLIKKLRNHFEEEHSIDYTMEAVTQMITNRGHSLESIK